MYKHGDGKPEINQESQILILDIQIPSPLLNLHLRQLTKSWLFFAHIIRVPEMIVSKIKFSRMQTRWRKTPETPGEYTHLGDCESICIVTGPSFTKLTFIIAPNTPSAHPIKETKEINKSNTFKKKEKLENSEPKITERSENSQSVKRDQAVYLTMYAIHQTYSRTFELRDITFDCIRFVGISEALNHRSMKGLRFLRRHRHMKIRLVALQDSVQCKLTHCHILTAALEFTSTHIWITYDRLVQHCSIFTKPY